MFLSLTSPEFLSLCVAAILGLSALSGAGKQVFFLSINLIFMGALLLSPVGALSTFLFCLLGYGVIRLIMWQPRWGFRAGMLVYILLFVYMRNYDVLGWLLPDSLLTGILATVGLSFIFFKILHVMIEVRSGTLLQVDFLSFLNYALNFTTFMMGPIQRFDDYISQWDGRSEALPANLEAYLDEILRILVGFVKVYVMAEWLAPRALAQGVDFSTLSLSDIVIKLYAFYFFLYLNFAGYCDVMIGVGSLMGIRPPENFNKPFLATNISDFWQRFHRSLTLWLTTYIFSPAYKYFLSSRRSAAYPLLSMNVALLLTMVVSGLWHGSTLNFFFFGLVHGIYFVIYRTWDSLMAGWVGKKRLKKLRKNPLYRLSGIFITLNAVAFSFLFFPLSAGEAWGFFQKLAGILG